jgi:hypothetical protein
MGIEYQLPVIEESRPVLPDVARMGSKRRGI